MPNWCEGNLRLRGSCAAMLEFFKNEIEIIGYKRGASVKNFIEGPNTSAPDIVDEYGEVMVKAPEYAQDWGFLNMYIKGTRRNFIDVSEFCICLGNEEDRQDVRTVCIDDVKAAWGFDPTPYVEKAKKYGLDIRIVGFERGMQVQQIIEIVGGELIKYEEIKFDDWDWECTMPNMGG